MTIDALEIIEMTLADTSADDPASVLELISALSLAGLRIKSYQTIDERIIHQAEVGEVLVKDESLATAVITLAGELVGEDQEQVQEEEWESKWESLLGP